MKKSVLIRANKFNSFNNFKLDLKSITFFVLFVCGLILGVLIIKNTTSDVNAFILKVIRNSTLAVTQSNLINIFSGTILLLFVLLFYVYVFGQCSVGIPFLAFAPLLWGTYSGIMTGGLYTLFGLKGLGYCAIVNLPCYAITATTLIRGCCIGTGYSNEIFLGMLTPDWKKQADFTLKNYSFKFLVLVVPLIMSALLKACSCKLFGELFALL